MNPLSIWRRHPAQTVPAITRLQSDFENLVQNLSEFETRFTTADFSPSCEMEEDKSNYIVKFDMPGIKKNNVKIELDGHQLIVSADRHEEHTTEDKRSRYSEIRYGSYHRTLTLPSLVDEKKVNAKFEDGVLTVTLPKSETLKTRQITVQ